MTAPERETHGKLQSESTPVGSTKKTNPEIMNDSLTDTEDELIDVSKFDFVDTERWLYLPPQHQNESAVEDLYSWLRSEPELFSTASRMCIDTRTFTRPKKRTSKINFDSISENYSPPTSILWKTPCSNFMNTEVDMGRGIRHLYGNKEETVPAMLKLSPLATTNLLSNETITMSSQDSIDVSFNMSQSKGIDSFINLTQSFYDPLMNTSEPSFLYSSITSLPRDDFSHNADYNRERKLENLMHIPNKEEEEEIEEDEDATDSNNLNVTFTEANLNPNNESYCINSADRTFTNNYSDVLGNLSLNEEEKISTDNLSSTFMKADDTELVEGQVRKISPALDTTYLSQESGSNSVPLDVTYSPLQRKNEDKVASTSIAMDTMPCDVRSPVLEISFNSVMKHPLSHRSQSTPKTGELNSTFMTMSQSMEQTRVHNSSSTCSMSKAPTLLRRELLTEIHRSGDHRLDSTYNHIGKEHFAEGNIKQGVGPVCDQYIRNDIPVENKYNTYKKESPAYRIRSQVAPPKDAAGGCAPKYYQDYKYHTFTKKSGIQGGKTDMENTETFKSTDGTYIRNSSKLQKAKQHIPRTFSKLPQFLQKSNPNLVSNSLKTVGGTEYSNASPTRYRQGSQPNINLRDVERSLANKLYPLEKIKSGSEQRLLELNTNATDFHIMGAGISTESIESTQSIHSAPDLDDRLSTCSDISHNSYTAQTMNIEQLHHIARMQEESLKQDSSSRLSRRVLENTWIEGKKDLLSPLTKNSSDNSENESPLNIDVMNLKTSSPLLSPTGSSQSLHTDDHPEENIPKQENELLVEEKAAGSNKPVAKLETKTRLRQPTNWSSGLKPPKATSSIPRPASRIPGPRFARPLTKSTQGDVKRGT